MPETDFYDRLTEEADMLDLDPDRHQTGTPDRESQRAHATGILIQIHRRMVGRGDTELSFWDWYEGGGK